MIDRCGEVSETSVRPSSYLKDEYVRRLESGRPVSYSLQAQFHSVRLVGDSDSDNERSRFYNPTSPWFGSPWIDLASLSFYSALPSSVVETMSFSTENLPAPAVSIPDPADGMDFNSIAAVKAAMEGERLALMEVRERSEDELSLEREDENDDGTVEMTDYLVYCVTGDRLNAGTNASVHVSIVGRIFLLFILPVEVRN